MAVLSTALAPPEHRSLDAACCDRFPLGEDVLVTRCEGQLGVAEHLVFGRLAIEATVFSDEEEWADVRALLQAFPGPPRNLQALLR
jgi:hypothetical protein